MQPEPPSNKTVFSIKYLEGDTSGRWTILDDQVGILATSLIEPPSEKTTTNVGSVNLERGYSYTRLFKESGSMFTQLSIGAYHVDDVNLALTQVSIDVRFEGELITPPTVAVKSVGLNISGIWSGVENLSLAWGAEMNMSKPSSNIELNSLTLSGDASLKFTEMNRFGLQVNSAVLLEQSQVIADVASSMSLQMNTLTLHHDSYFDIGKDGNLSFLESLHLYNSSIVAMHGRTHLSTPRLFIDVDASVNGSARGYGNCEGPGSAINSPSKNSFRLGGSHGGLGSYESVEEFVALEGKMLANDDVFWPQLPGSGGCGLSGRADDAGHGGAYLHLQVLEESEIWGEIDLSGGHADESSSNHGYVIFIDS
jgi:hypothetical protein